MEVFEESSLAIKGEHALTVGRLTLSGVCRRPSCVRVQGWIQAANYTTTHARTMSPEGDE